MNVLVELYIQSRGMNSRHDTGWSRDQFLEKGIVHIYEIYRVQSCTSSADNAMLWCLLHFRHLNPHMPL